MRYPTNHLIFVSYIFYLIIALFASSFGIVSDLDDESYDNSFFVGSVITCKNTLIPAMDPTLVNDCDENADAATYVPGIITYDRSYISSHCTDTMGINSDVPCVHTIPFTDIVLNFIALNVINQYLPKLNVIKTIFIPPRA